MAELNTPNALRKTPGVPAPRSQGFQDRGTPSGILCAREVSIVTGGGELT